MIDLCVNLHSPPVIAVMADNAPGGSSSGSGKGGGTVLSYLTLISTLAILLLVPFLLVKLVLVGPVPSLPSARRTA